MEHYFFERKKELKKILLSKCERKEKKYNVNSAFFFDEVQSFVINSNRYLVAIS